MPVARKMDDAISRADISLELFQSRQQAYLASFSWNNREVHTFGRKCGGGSVFQLKGDDGDTIGFITFSIDPGTHALTINTGGTTRQYRNRGFGIPLLDSFSSLVLVMGIEEVYIKLGQNNPFVLMMISQLYGFGPQQQRLEQAMMIGPPTKQYPELYPVHFLGDEARRLIEYAEGEDLPDPFGPGYRTVEQAEQMPHDSVTVYVGQPYRIVDRSKLYRRIFAFLPGLYHHPDPAQPHQRIIWKSHGLAQAQLFLMSDAGPDSASERFSF